MLQESPSEAARLQSERGQDGAGLNQAGQCLGAAVSQGVQAEIQLFQALAGWGAGVSAAGWTGGSPPTLWGLPRTPSAIRRAGGCTNLMVRGTGGEATVGAEPPMWASFPK